MIKLIKINDIKVKPVQVGGKYDNDKIQGYDYLQDLYVNCFIASKKKSGKTSLIYNILKNISNSLTKVFIICSTVHKDPTYKKILEMLDKKGIYHEEHLSLYDGNENVLNRWEKMNNVVKEEEPVIKNQSLRFDSDSEDDEIIKKPKKIAPEWIFVIDDLSNELGDKSIAYLLSRNRHFLSTVLISSQYYQHLSKQSRSQLDRLILFGKLPEDKLRIIYQESDLAIDYEKFIQMYYNATEQKYNFLYIDTRNEVYRKNFNMRYDIE